MIRVSSKDRYCFYWLIQWDDNTVDKLICKPFNRKRYHHVFALKQFLRDHGFDIQGCRLKIKVSSPVWEHPRVYTYSYSRDTPFMVKLDFKSYTLKIIEIQIETKDEYIYIKNLEIPISSIYEGDEYFLPLMIRNSYKVSPFS